MFDDRAGRRRQLILIATLAAVGAAAAAIAIATGALDQGSRDADTTAEQMAQNRCRTEVLARLMSPSTAHLSDVRTEQSPLDADGRDLFSLTLEQRLKGVDPSRITVLNVSGVVNAPSEVGSTLQDHFDCRAYFVDNALVHTLVLFQHEH